MKLYFDAAPNICITGRVDRILPKRVSGERPLYRVYIALDEVSVSVVEGMTVDTSIVLDARTDVKNVIRVAFTH